MGVAVYKTRGRTIKYTIQIKTDVVDVSDLTNAEIWFTVKSDPADSTNLIQKKTANLTGGSDLQVKVTDGPNGKIEVYISSIDTEDMESGEYKYDIAVKLDGATEPLEAVAPSTFTVKQPVMVLTS
jgi:hypothetical protein